MSKWRRRSRLGVAAVAVAAVFALGACGGEDNGDAGDDTDAAENEGGGDAEPEGEFRNGPVPEENPDDAWENDSNLPKEPDSGESIAKQVEYELLTDSAQFAREVDPEGAVECDIKDGEEGDRTCTATYFGLEFEYAVSLSGTSFVSYEYEASQRVVSRTYLEDALRYESDSEDVFCDLDEYELIDPEDFALECRSLTEGEEVSWEVSLSASYGNATFYRNS